MAEVSPFLPDVIDETLDAVEPPESHKDVESRPEVDIELPIEGVSDVGGDDGEAGELPSWLDQLSTEFTAQAEPTTPTAADELPSWLDELAGVDGADEKAAVSGPTGELPSWLKKLAGKEQKDAPTESSSASELPSWLDELGPEEEKEEPALPSPVSELPSWLDELGPEEEKEEPALPSPAGGFTSWLDELADQGAIRAREDGLPLAGSPEQQDEDDLFKSGQLPAWLEEIAELDPDSGGPELAPPSPLSPDQGQGDQATPPLRKRVPLPSHLRRPER